MAGLAPPVFPTMGELWGKQDEKVEKNKERDVSVKKNRNVCFQLFNRPFIIFDHKITITYNYTTYLVLSLYTQLC